MRQWPLLDPVGAQAGPMGWGRRDRGSGHSCRGLSIVPHADKDCHQVPNNRVVLCALVQGRKGWTGGLKMALLTFEPLNRSSNQVSELC
jgi:hypothetical protein